MEMLSRSIMSYFLREALRARDLPHSAFSASEIMEVHIGMKPGSAWILEQIQSPFTDLHQT